MTFIYQANETGIAQIKKILQTKHKKFLNEEPSKTVLYAWAEDAEGYIENQGNWDGRPSIGIKSTDAVSGHTELYELDIKGFDKVTIDE